MTLKKCKQIVLKTRGGRCLGLCRDSEKEKWCREGCSQMVLLSALILCLHLQVPEKLLLSACHLMVSLTSTVRPVFLVTLPAVQNIFNLITTENQTRRLPQEVKCLSLLFCVVCYDCYEINNGFIQFSEVANNLYLLRILIVYNMDDLAISVFFHI